MLKGLKTNRNFLAIRSVEVLGPLYLLKSKVVLLWVVIARANWKLLLSISMLLNLSK